MGGCLPGMIQSSPHVFQWVRLILNLLYLLNINRPNINPGTLMVISIIAAMDRNRLIGNKNQLPWHLPADFSHFKSVTMGKPVIMGRKTYESIGKPLPGRTNIVLSRDPDLSYEGVICVNSFEDAVAVETEAEELMIIGGSSIYEMLLPEIDRMYLTYVDSGFEGDAWFPDFDESQWHEVESVTHLADEKNKYDCRFVTLERVPVRQGVEQEVLNV